MMSHLFLLGFMGAGKTTVGAELARCLELPFVDLDERVVQQTGRSIMAIFETEGEFFFREVESRVLADVANEKPAVISTGGGIISRSDNWAIMENCGKTVYLRAAWPTLERRIGSGAGRPLASQNDGGSKLRALFDQRCPLYEQADVIVDTDGLAVSTVVSKIMDRIHEFS